MNHFPALCVYLCDCLLLSDETWASSAWGRRTAVYLKIPHGDIFKCVCSSFFILISPQDEPLHKKSPLSLPLQAYILGQLPWFVYLTNWLILVESGANYLHSDLCPNFVHTGPFPYLTWNWTHYLQNYSTTTHLTRNVYRPITHYHIGLLDLLIKRASLYSVASLLLIISVKNVSCY